MRVGQMPTGFLHAGDQLAPRADNADVQWIGGETVRGHTIKWQMIGRPENSPQPDDPRYQYVCCQYVSEEYGQCQRQAPVEIGKYVTYREVGNNDAGQKNGEALHETECVLDHRCSIIQ